MYVERTNKIHIFKQLYHELIIHYVNFLRINIISYQKTTEKLLKFFFEIIPWNVYNPTISFDQNEIKFFFIVNRLLNLTKQVILHLHSGPICNPLCNPTNNFYKKILGSFFVKLAST